MTTLEDYKALNPTGTPTGTAPMTDPAAIERAERVAASGRHIPEFFNLGTAIDNSRKNQTYNTPSVATLFLMAEQLDWMNAHGGLAAMVERTTASSDALYGWAERTAYTTPYVADPEHRSLVIGTIDFDDAIDAAQIAKVRGVAHDLDALTHLLTIEPVPGEIDLAGLRARGQEVPATEREARTRS